MARRSRGTGSYGDPVIGSLPSPERLLERLNALQQLSRLVRSIEDRRTFHPLGSQRTARSLSSRAGYSVSSGTPGRSLPWGFSFNDPELVARCVRRRMRREVLFAKRMTRKGAGASRRRDFYSFIGC